LSRWESGWGWRILARRQESIDWGLFVCHERPFNRLEEYQFRAQKGCVKLTLINVLAIETKLARQYQGGLKIYR
jgi:hypothetical protein